MNINLDRRSKVSIADQIELAIRREIFNHYLSFNESLPAISDLARELSVAENDVRVAYKKLKDDRLISIVDDKHIVNKVFVPTYLFDEVIPLVDIIKEVNLNPSITTLQAEIIPTPKHLKDLFDENTIIRCRRLYKGSDRPLFYLDIYINIQFEYLIDHLKNNEPYYDLILQKSLLHHSVRSYEAMNANKEIAGYLNIPDNTPVVYSKIKSYGLDNLLIEVIESYNLVEVQHFVIES